MPESEIEALIVAAVTRAVRDSGGLSGTIDASTPLVGDGAALDSVALVILVLDIEAELEARGVRSRLSEEEALMDADGPLASVGHLRDHLAALAPVAG